MQRNASYYTRIAHSRMAHSRMAHSRMAHIRMVHIRMARAMGFLLALVLAAVQVPLPAQASGETYVTPDKNISETEAKIVSADKTLQKAGTGAGPKAGQKSDSETESESEAARLKPFIVYISGVDTRDEELVNSNGDVNILMAVDPQTKNILLLNTPRDYYLQNPAGGNAMDKLTHCAAYGVDNSMKALEQLYDCSIDYFMQINFVGFEKFIDTLGGISVISDEEFDTTLEDGTTLHVVEGVNEFSGMEALAFARDRYHVAYGDNGRGRDQMRVIEAVINKITENPLNTMKLLPTLLKELDGTFRTDMPVGTVTYLLMAGLSDGLSGDSSSESSGDMSGESSGDISGESSDDVSGDMSGESSGDTSGDTSGDMSGESSDDKSWNVKRYAVTGHNGVDQTYSMASPTNVMYQDPELVAHAADLLDLTLNGTELTDEIVGETVEEW